LIKISVIMNVEQGLIQVRHGLECGSITYNYGEYVAEYELKNYDVCLGKFLYTFFFLVLGLVKFVTFFKFLCSWNMTVIKITCHHLVQMRLG